ncbi:MAG: transposase [Desulfobacteraceae bacterium]|jgi:putative transposase
MIRRVEHTLKFATAAKRQKLDDFFAEYARVVNAFIELYWSADNLPGKANSSVYGQVDSWMMGKARKCAANQAIRILKSVRKKDKQKTYKVYQRVYAKAKTLNRNVLGILSSKWVEWSKGKMFRHRVRMPVFNGNTVDLNSDLVHIQSADKSSEFDLWIRLGSIFGNRESLILPSKHHERSRHFQKTGWVQRKSICLRRDRLGRYYADVFWEKDGPKLSQRGQAVGVDIGINKLVTTSDGEELGTELRSKLDKLNRRKQNSRNWNQTRREIKDYIGFVINKFPWNTDVVVMENILNITQQTRGRVGKGTRKLLGHWNIDLLYRRMADKAEENRVFLAFVEPAYSSQTCNSCRTIDKKSRNGEVFKCTACGHSDDADHNASMNILQRFLDGQCTVARGT